MSGTLKQECFVSLLLLLGFEPLRMSVKGDMIRDGDSKNSTGYQLAKKIRLDDSDEDESTNSSSLSERPAMDIYRRRQQKRVKLGNNASTVDQTTPSVLI